MAQPPARILVAPHGPEQAEDEAWHRHDLRDSDRRDCCRTIRRPAYGIFPISDAEPGDQFRICSLCAAALRDALIAALGSPAPRPADLPFD